MALFDDTRADWGARKPQGPIYTVPIASRTEKFAHWNGGPLGITDAKSHTTCLAAVKAIQAEHMHDDPSHNWSDIGYNALVCPAHARLIEGRGRDAVGAHCPNHNRSGIAVQFMLGKGETATPAMFARAARFFGDCETAARHALKPMGHRDGYATECPGDQIEAWVKAGMPGTTTTTGGFLMALSDADQQKVLDAANRVLATGTASPRLLNDGDGKTIREDIGFIRDQIRGDLSKMSAQQVADSIPDNLAQQVVDLLAARLNPKGA